MSEPLVFADDVEQAGWFVVFAHALAGPARGLRGSSAEYADGAVKYARERSGRDLQAENVQLRQELAEARAAIDQLHDELAQLDDREAADALHDTTEHLR